MFNVTVLRALCTPGSLRHRVGLGTRLVTTCTTGCPANRPAVMVPVNACTASPSILLTDTLYANVLVAPVEHPYPGRGVEDAETAQVVGHHGVVGA